MGSRGQRSLQRHRTSGVLHHVRHIRQRGCRGTRRGRPVRRLPVGRPPGAHRVPAGPRGDPVHPRHAAVALPAGLVRRGVRLRMHQRCPPPRPGCRYRDPRHPATHRRLQQIRRLQDAGRYGRHRLRSLLRTAPRPGCPVRVLPRGDRSPGRRRRPRGRDGHRHSRDAPGQGARRRGLPAAGPCRRPALLAQPAHLGAAGGRRRAASLGGELRARAERPGIGGARAPLRGRFRHRGAGAATGRPEDGVRVDSGTAARAMPRCWPTRRAP